MVTARGTALAPTAHGANRATAPVGRVLMIDDEQRILNFVRRGLEAEGLEVDEASSGQEGLDLALDGGTTS